MRQRHLLVRFLCLLPALDLITAGPFPDNDSDLMRHRIYNKSAAVKNISKRNVDCQRGKYRSDSGDICCDLCKPGYVKVTDCTTSSKTICKICEEGEEYMDDYNSLLKCKRCSICDRAHGLEDEKPCNISQNIKCRCQHGFFCSSLEPCLHCNPCTECENGIIVEECTSTKDRICGSKRNLLWIIGIVILFPLIIGTIITWKYLSKKRRTKKKHIEDDHGQKMEMKLLTYEDIDLAPHISDIAEDMTLEQVMKFVRKRGLTNPTIDKINADNANDASEKKIRLLETWYQENGIKSAYGILIRTLKDLKQHTLADKIQKKMDSHVLNNASAHQNMILQEGITNN
ncbi:tumor necrosis factor receptor superfamily member 6 [Eublepharis macularius]|uniref:Tumor necrosis factor receptor superfamily member 6 n=1 Tax=Eublepharis macularius TaxID=481883 RepID=A0AA97JK34_EUBMA|nr:tumor necrosis factor receptor superfamily member 6 [Eublepharis macularius]